LAGNTILGGGLRSRRQRPRHSGYPGNVGLFPGVGGCVYKGDLCVTYLVICAVMGAGTDRRSAKTGEWGAMTVR
jgi:hypothetical protein